MKTKPVAAIQVRLSSEDYRLLKKLVEHLDLDMSKTVRRAIRELAKKNKVE